MCACVYVYVCACSNSKRMGSLDSNIAKGSLEPANIPGLLKNHPSINRMIFPNNSASIFAKKEVFGRWLETGWFVVVYMRVCSERCV